MSIRVYMVPRAGDGTKEAPYRPKYTAPGDLGAGNDLTGWDSLDYGVENLFLVTADVTAGQHTALVANVDVVAFPLDLTNTVSAGQLSNVHAQLEAVGVPADWVTVGMTYRRILKTVIKIILLAQRFNGLHGLTRIFDSGVTLDTAWSQLTANQKTRLQQVGTSLGVDGSSVNNATTMRQILRLLADQLPDVTWNGQVF